MRTDSKPQVPPAVLRLKRDRAAGDGARRGVNLA